MLVAWSCPSYVKSSGTVIDALFDRFAGRPASVKVDFSNSRLTIADGDSEEVVSFVISDFDRRLVEAGGWVDFADTHY